MKINIAKKRDLNRANQHGQSIINDPQKVKALINDAKTMSKKEILDGLASYKVSRRVLDSLKINFGLVYGKKSKSGAVPKYNIKEIFKHSHPDTIKAHKNKEIDDSTLRKRYYTKKRRDKMSMSEKKKLDKDIYENLTNEQIQKKNKRNKEYLENLSQDKINRRKAQDHIRSKKRWKNMSEEEKEIKRKRDREWQKDYRARKKNQK